MTTTRRPWQDDIAGCFGEADKRFAGHPLDAERALKLLLRLRQEGVDWGDFESAVRKHLKTAGCSGAHIDEQMAMVRARMKPWLAGEA